MPQPDLRLESFPFRPQAHVAAEGRIRAARTISLPTQLSGHFDAAAGLRFDLVALRHDGIVMLPVPDLIESIDLNRHAAAPATVRNLHDPALLPAVRKFEPENEKPFLAII